MDGNNLGLYITLGGIVILLTGIVLVWLFARSNKVNLTETKEGEKPEWMQSTPPKETLAATQAEGKGVALFNLDTGEKLAAPFAEQIEDILQTILSADPKLSSHKVDFGTASDGGLEIWVDGKAYSAIQDIPDEPVRAAIQQAIANYNEQK